MNAAQTKTSWDLNLIIKKPTETNILSLRKKVEIASYKFINKWNKRTDYLSDPSVLKKALDDYENWLMFFGINDTENYYYSLKNALDQNDPVIKAKINKAIEISHKILNDIQFFELNISKVDTGIQKKFLKYKQLKPYKHFLEKLFLSGKYQLSEKEEKILNLKSQTSYLNWINMLSSFLAKEEVYTLDNDGEEKRKYFSDLFGLIQSKNNKVRDSAANKINNILKKHLDVAENEMNSMLLDKKVNDELRNYNRPDKARHLKDDIDTNTVDALVKVVSENFDISKDYYQFKSKLFGVKKLKYHERVAEYGNIDKKYTFQEGLGLINEVFKKLDPQFSQILESFVKNRQIDVYPQKGKVGGAFCSHNLITNPTYILLNWTDKLDDVRTFAHELGHGINNELIREKQNAINFGTPTSTAEVASTFMEDFVIQKLQNEADEELKLSLIVSKLDSDVASIFRQIACYKFERQLHEDFRRIGYLSKEMIGDIFKDNMEDYMGPAIEQSEGSENWWVYWSHIRRHFYVYSYASGLLISKSLQAGVKDNSTFINEVKRFLSTGKYESPRDIFKKLRIDITDKQFWEKGLREIRTSLGEAKSLAIKLKKI